MSRLKNLLRTTAVKLSVRYSLLYIFIFGVAFLILYYFITSFVEDQIKVNLIKESKKVEAIYKRGGVNAVKDYILSHEKFKGEDHKYYLLVSRNGKTIAGDLKKWPSNLKVNEPVKNVWVSQRDIIGKVEDGDGFWPMIAVKFKNGVKALIAQGIRGTEDLRETLFAIMVSIYGLIVILLLTLGISLGKNILRHAESIEDACESIMGGDLTKRITVSDRNDEFDTIARHINGMLDELERFIKQSRESSNSIAHDLKTPLNRMRNRLEMILLGKEQNILESLEGIIENIDKMIKMINSLLEISQIETGALRRNWGRVDVSALVGEAIDFYQPMAEEKGIEISFDTDDSIFVVGNKQLLSQSILNILDNAVKYTQDYGKISVSVKSEGDSVVVSVCDNGPGVDEEDYSKLTEKFFRLDKSRTLDGNGLGLSLVKAVADLHKAKLIFKDNDPGLCVMLKFYKSS